MLSPHDADIVRRDTSLPGLETVLDPDAFCAALRVIAPGADVDSATTTYVRYKPGTSCLVGFEVEISGETVLLNARAHRTDASGKLDKGRERSGIPGPLGSGRFVFPDKAVVVSVFPNDSQLEALERIDDPEQWPRLLERVFPQAQALWPAVPAVLRYKPERRCAVKLMVDGEPRGVLKFYTELGFPAAHVASRALASSDRLRLPARVGRSRRHHLLAYEWLPGRTLGERMHEGADVVSLLPSVGAALAELHAQEAPELPFRNANERCEAVWATAASLEAILPTVGDRAKEMARRLAGLVPADPTVPRPLHGDFYSKQVVIDEDGSIGVIDLDEAALGGPRSDLGNFVAHLERDLLRGNLPETLIGPARDGLVSGYEAAAGVSVALGVEIETAVALFRLAPDPFRHREPGWPDRVTSILDRVETMLTSLQMPRRSPADAERAVVCSQSGTEIDGSVTVSDPFGAAADAGIPTLARALDPDEVQNHLRTCERVRELVGQPELRAIRVVRLKRGRRCLIEYDLSGPDGGEVTLVGKVRARGADRSTYRVTEALWEAGFSDEAADGICVPEPVGVLRDLGLWLQVKREGVSAALKLGGPDGVALCERIAEVALKLHRAGVEPERRHTLADELGILQARLPRVAAENPAWASRIDRLLEACNRLCTTLESEPFAECGIHRDFYPDQVLVDGHRLYLLDFDLYCWGDPALDIGNFLAHMTEQSLRSFGEPDGFAAQEQALEEGYLRRARTAVTAARIQAYKTLTLARHVYISTQFEDRRHSTQAILSLCEVRMARHSVLPKPVAA
jgi:aminoglycoside phosphotransferase (APT) family kinase protein